MQQCKLGNICNLLLGAGDLQCSDIGVISPYAGQIRTIEK